MKNILTKKMTSVTLIFILIIITIMLLCGLNKNEVKAETLCNNYEYTYISENVAIDIAKTRMSSLSGQEVNIDSVKKIYNMDETLFGYNIIYSTDKTKDTIIIRDTNINSLVVHKFSLNTPKEAFAYNYIEEDNSRAYLVSAFDIAVSVGNNLYKIGNSLINKYDIDFDINDYLPKNYMPEIDSSLINKDYTKTKDWTSSSYGYKETRKYITDAKKFIPETQYRLNSKSDVGNCGPTAVFNALKYYNDCRYNGSIFGSKSNSEVYQKIVNYMGNEDGTTIYEMSGGFEKYIEHETSLKASYIHYVPPMWGYFKGDLNKNYPVLYTIAGKSGTFHAMTAVGYLELEENKKFFPKKYKFLIVASGWNSYLEYTNFESVSWKLGCVLKIS